MINVKRAGRGIPESMAYMEEKQATSVYCFGVLVYILLSGDTLDIQ